MLSSGHIEKHYFQKRSHSPETQVSTRAKQCADLRCGPSGAFAHGQCVGCWTFHVRTAAKFMRISPFPVFLPKLSSSFFSSLIDYFNAVYTTFLLAYIQNASEKREPLHFDHHPAAKYVAAWTPPHRHRVRGGDTSTGNTKKKALFPPNFDSFLENCITIYILS